jgi:hypothetical protein
MVLESPIADRCASAGLKGCPQITEGILLVVEGDKEGGTEKLRSGIAENAPGDFQDFVAAMRLLGKVPGAGQYVAPINQVLATVSPTGATGKSAKPRKHRGDDDRTVATGGPQAGDDDEGRPQRLAAADGPAKAPAPPVVIAQAAPDPKNDPSKWEGETITPLTHPQARQCSLGELSPLGPNATGRCVRVQPGPLVLTELDAPGGCTGELFALAGSLSAPRWVLYAPPSGALHLTRYLVVREKEYLVVGTAATSENKLRGDMRCSITWGGFHLPDEPNPTEIKNPYPQEP